MHTYASVCWLPCSEPWMLENELLGGVRLPLNLHGNSHDPFGQTLAEVRRRARQLANQLPVLDGA